MLREGIVMLTPLERETQAAILLRENIIAELGPDEQLIADSIEGQTNLHEIIATLAREAVRRKQMAEAMKAIIEDNQKRKWSHERAADAIRGAIARAMTSLDLPKIPLPDITISARISAPSPKCTSVDMLPDALRRIKTEISADMAKISDYIADTGEVPSGVVMTNGSPILTLRTR
jgi:Siphovirus Gp157